MCVCADGSGHLWRRSSIMRRRLLIVAGIAIHALSIPTGTHVFMEEATSPLHERADLVRSGRSGADATHEVIFLTQERNLDKLAAAVLDVSNPTSKKYGNYWTPEQIAELTANYPARDAIVSYLRAEHVLVVNQTRFGEMIIARASVAHWERVFDTEFYAHHYVHPASGTVSEHAYHRADRYSLPAALHGHVATVFNTVQLPLPLPKGPSLFNVPPAAAADRSRPTSPSATAAAAGARAQATGFGSVTVQKLVTSTMTPAKIAAAYDIDSSAASPQATQAVVSMPSGPQWNYMNRADLAYSQQYFNLPSNPVKLFARIHRPKVTNDDTGAVETTYYGGDNIEACPNSKTYPTCFVVEGNLDIQYITSTAQGAPTTWAQVENSRYTDAFIILMLALVQNLPTLPWVFSISYGALESQIFPSFLTLFDTTAQKVSLTGRTIVVASGDSGTSDGTTCGYMPQYPTASPWVLSVGGTQGPESGVAERVCSSALGGIITSAGGFSKFYPTPSWQTAHVASYFTTAAAAGVTPYPGYNADKRGYPDVSLAAANYQTRENGVWMGESGTSASAPTVAGMLTLINTARLAAGKPTVGFVNPALYHLANTTPGVFHDITLGSNHCMAQSSDERITGTTTCCNQGFTAVAGWDPVSGLGSVNFRNLKAAMMLMVGVTPTPSAAPTPAPTGTLIVQVTATATLSGVAVANFQGAMATTFIAVLTAATGLPAAAITVVSADSRVLEVASTVVVATAQTTTATGRTAAALRSALTSYATRTQLVSSLGPYGVMAAVVVAADSSPTSAPTPGPTAKPFSSSGSGGGGGSSGGSSSGRSCFAGTETVTLPSGASKAISEVTVGDRILTVNAHTGEFVYSDVAYLPHGKNTETAVFTVLTTAAGRDVKMTANHMLPAGACDAAKSLPVVAASAVAVGECVQTVSGRDRVVSVGTVEGEGIYTAIAMEELLVVNGIVATPYGGVNPALANVYYNLHRLWYAVARGGELLAVVFTTRDATARLWAALAALSA